MTLIQKDYIEIKCVFFSNQINNTPLIKRKFFENIKINGSLSAEIIGMVH